MKNIRFYRLPDILNESDVRDFSEDIIVNCVGIDVTSEKFHTVRPVGRKDNTVLFVLEGSMCFNTKNGGKRILSQGQGIVLHHDRVQNYYSDSKNCSFIWVHFTGIRADETLNRFGLTHEFIYSIDSADNIVHIFNKIIREFTLKRYDYIYCSAIHLRELLLTVKRHIVNKQTTVKKLEKSLEYIKNNYTEDISVETLAEIEGVSVSYYRKIFIGQMDVSPKQYIISLKISHAISQLQHTAIPIHKIAAECGFNDLTYFHRIFKKFTGFTPKTYRELTIKEATDMIV